MRQQLQHLTQQTMFLQRKVCASDGPSRDQVGTGNAHRRRLNLQELLVQGSSVQGFVAAQFDVLSNVVKEQIYGGLRRGKRLRWAIENNLRGRQLRGDPGLRQQSVQRRAQITDHRAENLSDSARDPPG